MSNLGDIAIYDRRSNTLFAVIALTFLVLPVMGMSAQYLASTPSCWEGEDGGERVYLDKTPAIQWGTTSLYLALSPDCNTVEWARGNAVQIWIRNSSIGGDSVEIRFLTDIVHGRSNNYYKALLPLDFLGWFRIVLPKNRFIKVGSPIGWNAIVGVELLKIVSRNTNVYALQISKISVVDSPSIGPVISNYELFSALDTSYKFVNDVLRLASHDSVKAIDSLGSYLRIREKFGEGLTVSRGADKQLFLIADAAVNGAVKVAGIWHTFTENDFNWRFNPTIDNSAFVVNHEWQWQLCRLGWWAALADAWALTSDEKYVLAWTNQMHDFIADNPAPYFSSISAGSSWRSIDAGIRMAYGYPKAHLMFSNSEKYTNSEVVLLFKSALEHARFLRRNLSRNNWLTMELQGLHAIGELFPEFSESKYWRKAAIDRTVIELDNQFYPDGSHVEQSPGYHSIALLNLRGIYDKAVNSVFAKDQLDSFRIRFQEPYDFYMKISQPDRSLPLLNDSWHIKAHSELEKGLQLFPARNDWRWIVTGGEEGTLPGSMNFFLQDAGWCIFRSGWEPGSIYAHFNAGPPGVAHIHHDALSLTLFAFGKQHLVDDGGGEYEISKWREFAKSTASHSTARVNGLAQVRKAGIADTYFMLWDSSSGVAVAEARYSGGWGSGSNYLGTHTRRVSFINSQFFMVDDLFNPTDTPSHQFQVLWQKPDSARILKDPNLLIIPLSQNTVDTVIGQMEPELLGWRVLRTKVKRASTIKHEVMGKGALRILNLLLPIPAGYPDTYRLVKNSPQDFEVYWGDGNHWIIHYSKGRIQFSDRHGGVKIRREFRPNASIDLE